MEHCPVIVVAYARDTQVPWIDSCVSAHCVEKNTKIKIILDRPHEPHVSTTFALESSEDAVRNCGVQPVRRVLYVSASPQTEVVDFWMQRMVDFVLVCPVGAARSSIDFALVDHVHVYGGTDGFPTDDAYTYISSQNMYIRAFSETQARGRVTSIHTFVSRLRDVDINDVIRSQRGPHPSMKITELDVVKSSEFRAIKSCDLSGPMLLSRSSGYKWYQVYMRPHGHLVVYERICQNYGEILPVYGITRGISQDVILTPLYTFRVADGDTLVIQMLQTRTEYRAKIPGCADFFINYGRDAHDQLSYNYAARTLTIRTDTTSLTVDFGILDFPRILQSLHNLQSTQDTPNAEATTSTTTQSCEF